MVFYTTWKAGYKGDSALEEVHQTFDRIYEKLLNLGHLIDERDFNERNIPGLKEDAYARFILADKMPIAVAYVTADKFLNEKAGNILLGVRHFHGFGFNFLSLEEIAKQNHLISQETFVGKS